MSINIPPHKRRDTVLRMPIGQLVTWHIMAAYDDCRIDRGVLVCDLVERFGPDKTLLSLLAKFRCCRPVCRQRPSRLRLRNKFPSQPGLDLVDVLLMERVAGSVRM